MTDIAEQSVKMLRRLRSTTITVDMLDDIERRLASKMTANYTPLVCECFHAIRALRHENLELRNHKESEFWLTRNKIRIEVATVMIELLGKALIPSPATSAPTASTETPKPVQSAKDQDG